MSTRYTNSPLVEAVAELRWPSPHGLMQPGVPTPIMPPASQVYENGFSLLTAKMAELGCHQVERLVPPGFPLMPSQPTFRFKPSSDKAGGPNFLYQAGPFFFAANALQPYTEWTSFSKAISDGLSVFETVESLAPDKINCSPTLRYINAFKGELVEGFDVFSFICNVLNIKIELPRAITDKVSGGPVKPSLQLQIPVEAGFMSINLGEGVVESESAIILDIVVSCKVIENFSREHVCASFEQAHQLIHDTFFELTESISAAMKPEVR